ncbi:MAG: hypothetical protein ACLPKZ_09580 [Acidimicrobiales bacterium]
MRTLSATLVVAAALLIIAAPGSASGELHLVVEGTTPINEGAYTCGVAWSNQGNSELDRTLEVEVRTPAGNIADLSGTVIVEAGPASTDVDCPYLTPDGPSTESVYLGTARLIRGVAKFTSIGAPEGGTYSIVFVYRDLSTLSTPLQLNAVSSSTPRSGTAPRR